MTPRRTLVFRIRAVGLMNNDPSYGFRPLTPEEFRATGIYATRVHYAEAYRSAWEW